MFELIKKWNDRNQTKVVDKWYAMSTLFKVWNDDEKARWQSMSKHGKTHFVIKYGVIGWGGWCFFCVTAGVLYLDGTYEASPTRIVLCNALAFALGGALFGHFVWEGTTKSYKREISKPDDR